MPLKWFRVTCVKDGQPAIIATLPAESRAQAVRTVRRLYLTMAWKIVHVREDK